MNADRQSGFDRCLIDRPIPLLAHRLAGAAAEQHLHEPAITGTAADFRNRSLGVLIRHDHRSKQTVVAMVPAMDLKLVRGCRHRRAKSVVLVALPGRRQRIHHREFDRISIKKLPLHEIEIAAGQSAAGRPGIAARRIRLAFG